MKQSTMEAYAEVDTILNFMNEQYVQEIPRKIREMFKTKKAQEYSINIDPSKSLDEQNLKEETLSILAVLNYKYWCKDEKRKRELLKIYNSNEKRYQQELREKFDTDNLFNNEKKIKSNATEESIKGNVYMTEYKDNSFLARILQRIKEIF